MDRSRKPTGFGFGHKGPLIQKAKSTNKQALDAQMQSIVIKTQQSQTDCLT